MRFGLALFPLERVHVVLAVSLLDGGEVGERGARLSEWGASIGEWDAAMCERDAGVIGKDAPFA